MKTIKLVIMLFIISYYSTAQMYQKKKDNIKNPIEVQGWYFDEAYHDAVLDSIYKASNFSELPNELPFIDYPSNIEAYRVMQSDGNLMLKEIQLSNEGLFSSFKKQFISSKDTEGLPLTATGFFRLKRVRNSSFYGSTLDVIPTNQYNDKKLFDMKYYHIRINDQNGEGMKVVRWYNTSNRYNGHVLIREYYDKLKELNKPHLDSIAHEEYRKKVIEDSIRNVEIQKKEEQRQKELEERKKELISKYGKTKGTLIFEEKVQLGFNKEQALEAWGEPDDINKTIMTNYTREQWVYERSNYQHQYLYFENGVLTTIQD